MNTHTPETHWCERCGVEIEGSGWVLDGHLYCCQDCAAGRPCDCAAPMEEDEGYNRGHGLPASP